MNTYVQNGQEHCKLCSLNLTHSDIEAHVCNKSDLILQCEQYRTMLERIANEAIGDELGMEEADENTTEALVSVATVNDLRRLLGWYVEPNNKDKVKIHITMRKGATTGAVNRVIASGRMTEVNLKRAYEYGIISGMAPKTTLDLIRALPWVESVSDEETKETQE